MLQQATFSFALNIVHMYSRVIVSCKIITNISFEVSVFLGSLWNTAQLQGGRLFINLWLIILAYSLFKTFLFLFILKCLLSSYVNYYCAFEKYQYQLLIFLYVFSEHLKLQKKLVLLVQHQGIMQAALD